MKKNKNKYKIIILLILILTTIIISCININAMSNTISSKFISTNTFNLKSNYKININNNNVFSVKTFNISIDGRQVWSDGNYIYYSNGKNQYVFNGISWVSKTWNNLTSFYGQHVWTDGTNIYYSYSANQYILNGNTWETITWSGYNPYYGNNIWSDGTNIYSSINNAQYVLNGNTWTTKSWSNLTSFVGANVWTDGTNIYYSAGTNQYKLVNGNWVSKTWTNLTDFRGEYIWTNGIDIYYIAQYDQYKLNGSTWVTNNFTINNNYYIYGNLVWTDGTKIYLNSTSNNVNYVLGIAPTSQQLSKTYNTGNFLNNSQNYDAITINGQSSDNSTFDSVESIKYNNTIVYKNNAWVSGYSSTLGYTYEMNVPSLSTLNSDQNIVTFNTQLVQDTFQQIYNIEFINGNNVSYDTITINGTTLNGTTFNTINNIYYDLTQVYSSGYFISPYTSVLNYIYTMNQPNVAAINTSCNNIVTFTTNLLAVNYDNTYNIGYFINNDGYFDSVRIVGTTLNGTTYNNIQYIKYNDTFVYNNNNWLDSYNGLLYYNYGATPPDIVTLNQVQNIVIFSSQMISLEQTVLDKMTASYNGIIDIVQQTANTITSGQIVLTIMCVALPLTMFIGSIFIKIFKSRKGKT